jgi:hypothetical protein
MPNDSSSDPLRTACAVIALALIGISLIVIGLSF